MGVCPPQETRAQGASVSRLRCVSWRSARPLHLSDSVLCEDSLAESVSPPQAEEQDRRADMSTFKLKLVAMGLTTAATLITLGGCDHDHDRDEGRDGDRVRRVDRDRDMDHRDVERHEEHLEVR